MSRRVLAAGCAVMLATSGAAAQQESVDVDAVYVADVLSNVDGGLSAGTRVMHLASLGVEGTQVFGNIALNWRASGIVVGGDGLSEELVGDDQVASNVEAGFTALLPYEVALELENGRQGVLLGLYDVNAEFDVLDSAALFVNSSHGIGFDIGQTGVNGPAIYPVTGLAARYRYDAADFSLRLAAVDAVPGDAENPGRIDLALDRRDGAFLIGEVERRFDDAKVLVGAWRYARDDRGDPAAPGGHGVYLRGEGTIRDATIRKLSAFGRIGTASSRENDYDLFIGAGVTVDAPFAARLDDQAGVAIAAGRSARRDDRPDGAYGELNIEASYAYVARPGLVIQPDLQYVIAPGASTEIGDALILGVRFIVEAP